MKFYLNQGAETITEIDPLIKKLLKAFCFTVKALRVSKRCRSERGEVDFDLFFHNENEHPSRGEVEQLICLRAQRPLKSPYENIVFHSQSALVAQTVWE